MTSPFDLINLTARITTQALAQIIDLQRRHDVIGDDPAEIAFASELMRRWVNDHEV